MIVSAETGGLGNRIKSWVSATRMAGDAAVYWPVTANMPARFNDLFANDVAVQDIPDGAQVYASWRLAIFPDDEANIPRRFAVVGGGAHPILRSMAKRLWALQGRPNDRYKYMVFAKKHSKTSARRDGRNIDFEYSRIPQALRDTYRPLFDRIAVNDSIAKRVTQWWTEFGGDDVVGVQIRTWRDDARRHRKYHLPAESRLDALLNSLQSRRIFIVSDSDDSIDALKEKLGPDRVLSYARATRRIDSWQSSNGVQEDLIDMLLLSRTHSILASYMSTFSETAWWLGGAKADVEVF